MAEKQSLLSPGINAIETPVLNIRKNLIIWKDTMIQISNVSYISAAPPEMLPFPNWAFGATVIGGFLLALNSDLIPISMVLIACGIAFLYLWFTANAKRQQTAILSIRMNSGQTLDFKFYDKDFMSEVMAVLEQIMLNGGTTTQNIEINIKDSVISKSNVLNDLTANMK